MNKLGNFLKEKRLKNHYTQDYIADYLHVSRSTYANWERNHSFPDYDKLVSLCDLYQVSADFFLGRTNECTEYQFNEQSSYLVSKNNLSESEKKLLHYYQNLSSTEKDILLGKAAELFKNNSLKNK